MDKKPSKNKIQNAFAKKRNKYIRNILKIECGIKM